MRLPAILSFTAVLAVGAAHSRTAGAGPLEKAPAPTDAFDRALDAIGSPAREKPVREALRSASGAGSETAMRLVGRLRHAGGPAATNGLVALATSHADAGVRAASLRSAAAIGLRTEAVADVRMHLADADVGVRAAACDALGRMGEGEDVDRFLALVAEEKDRKVLQAAYRGLVALTGVRAPYDRDTWVYWWSTERAARGERVTRALVTLTTAGDERKLASARGTLQRDGWIRVTEVREAARLWLANGDAPMRAEAYRLATALRLGSLARDVADAFHFETDPDAREQGEYAVGAVGAPQDRKLALR